MDRVAYIVVFRGLAVSILLAVSVDIGRDTRFTAAQNCKASEGIGPAWPRLMNCVSSNVACLSLL